MLLLLTLAEPFERLRSCDIFLRLIRIEFTHILLVVEPLLGREVALEGDGAKRTTRRVRSIEQWFCLLYKLRQEIVGLPDALCARQVLDRG